MKQELQEILYTKYKLIFKQKDLSMRQTCMCWGIEHDDGWFHILDVLCHQIQQHVDQRKDVVQVEATQVKEKFGSLRFYYNAGDNYVEGLVDMAEALSSRTCEICGNPGKICGIGWYKTLCDECEGKK